MIDILKSPSKVKYGYHYQDSRKALIFRYDNANHKPALSQREHKHVGSDIILTPAATLQQVLDEILTAHLQSVC